MNLLIIDKDVRRYQPQLILTEIDDEISISKFIKVYIYIDNINYLKYISKDYDNVIFVCDHDIPVDLSKFMVKKLSCEIDKDYDFKDKIIKQSFIHQYLYK